jgi:penicillin amidase
MIVFTDAGVVGYEVTPPGQSGFVAPDGTKSRHALDQFELYESFGKKRMWFYSPDVERNKQSEITISVH